MYANGEADAGEQARQLQQMIDERVDVILPAPVEAHAIASGARNAKQAGMCGHRLRPAGRGYEAGSMPCIVDLNSRPIAVIRALMSLGRVTAALGSRPGWIARDGLDVRLIAEEMKGWTGPRGCVAQRVKGRRRIDRSDDFGALPVPQGHISCKSRQYGHAEVKLWRMDPLRHLLSDEPPDGRPIVPSHQTGPAVR
ncbi:hypothetical protein [Streptomyces aurantiogriseus]|uniref:Uncharacterized protein n=1 Tax=Streptomyces aurantiogriseus TaxID=66870 RepID=A0A918BZ26_9ACTN|nr:hypothetical protein [Streptomyces aurantiogriseus]GGQ97797.1 hypothetical protein GCM10010251_11030 [Streptomyces aurantiogriseus]